MKLTNYVMNILNVKPEKREKFAREAKSLTKFIIGFLIFSTLFFKPFNIPTGSMIPNLLIGDFLVVNKFAYGYTRYSLPFGAEIDWFKGRIIPENPKVGDIGVFHNPKDHEPFSILGIRLWDSAKDYVKRIIALPGDRVQMRKGRLWINRKECPIKRIEDFPMRAGDLPYRMRSSTNPDEMVMVERYLETLPNGVQHTYIKCIPFGKAPAFYHDPDHSSDDTPEYVVPENHFMIIGDNRDGSLDSRYMNDKVTFIPFDHLMGKVAFVFFSTSAKLTQIHKWFTGLRLERVMSIPK